MMRLWPSLRFDSIEDEQRFVSMSAPGRLQHFIISGWIALLVFNGFLVVDWHISQDVFWLALGFRLGGLTVLGVAVLVFAMKYKSLMLRLPLVALEGLIVSSGWLAALTLAAVLLISPTMQNSPWGLYYHGGFVPVLIYGNVAQRLRFGMALIFSLGVLLIHWICLALSANLPPALLVPMPVFVATMAFYTLITNYRLESEERQRFLQGLRAQDLRDQLTQTQRQLEASSLLDPLTGVANRRYFDDFMNTVWRARLERDQPLALLLVDVDHFKAYNDHYGHPAGDECLRYIARALQEQINGHDGLVARWGGEEFAVVLPGKDAAAAEALAISIARAVQGLGLRHERSSTAATVTVSIGVSTDVADAEDAGWDDLVARADAALYEAKRLGRNRTIVSRVPHLA